MRGLDAFLDARQLVETGQRDEAIGPQRVEADGDAAQAGGLEFVDLVARAGCRCS